MSPGASLLVHFAVRIQQGAYLQKMVSHPLLIAICPFLMALVARGESGIIDDIISNLGLVKFYLYTRENLDVGQRLYVDDVASLKKSNFRSYLKTKVVISGWFSVYFFDMGPEVTYALLDYDDYNVIEIDWSLIDLIPIYSFVCLLLPLLGKHVGNFLLFLFKNEVSPGDVHLIGHSLGAHVVGFAGKATKSAGISVDRITGLDPPSMLLFSQDTPEYRLSQGDADFVDVIHTDTSCLGADFKIGDADFYPNGGFEQPGCSEWVPPTSLEVFKTININWKCLTLFHTPFYNLCAHSRSYKFFAASTQTDEPFYADEKCELIQYGTPTNCTKLDRIQQMGIHANRRVKGSFFLTTNNETPYSK